MLSLLEIISKLFKNANEVELSKSLCDVILNKVMMRAQLFVTWRHYVTKQNLAWKDLFLEGLEI